MIYLVPIFLLIAITFTIGDNKKFKIIKKFILITFCLSFVFISAFRFETGTDWFPYYSFFNFYSYQEMLSFYFEPFYKLLAVFIKYLFNNYTIFLFIVGLFFLIEVHSLWKIAEKNIISYNIIILLLSSYMFFFPGFMGGNRQAIALALCAVSLKYLVKKNLLTSILYWSISMLFHYSAILFVFNIIIYLLISDNEKKLFKLGNIKVFFLVVVFFGSMYLIYNGDFLAYFNKSPILSNLVSYQGYSAVNLDLNYDFRDTVLILERLGLNFIIIFAFRYYKKSKINKFLLASYTFGTIFYIFFMFNARTIAGRGILYFRYADIFILATLPKALSNRILDGGNDQFKIKGKYLSELMVSFLVISYIIFRFLFVILYANSIYYLPYKSIFK